MQTFIKGEEIFPEEQFGFRKQLAVTQQAANLVSEPGKYKEPRNQVVSSLIDIEKAYDKAWSDGLVNKVTDKNSTVRELLVHSKRSRGRAVIGLTLMLFNIFCRGLAGIRKG